MERRSSSRGGTSLSKAYGLIDRFSEDVDLLVGFDDGTTTSAAHRMFKEIDQRARLDVGLGDERVEVGPSEKGIHRSTRYLYPVRVPSGIVTEGVLLELGRRGGTLPQQTKGLSSMIARHAVESGLARPDEFDEFAPFEMQILAPERTLVEKLLLLHRLAARSDANAALAAGRHMYDVCKLLTDDDTLNALRSEPDLVARIAEDALAHSERWGFDTEPRPEAGFATSPAFDTAGPTIDLLRDGYRHAVDLIYGEIPSFDACIGAVHASRGVL